MDVVCQLTLQSDLAPDLVEHLQGMISETHLNKSKDCDHQKENLKVEQKSY